MSTAGISIQGLTKRFVDADGRELKVLDGIDLTIRDGEFLSIIGPSGCGKSTFLNILCGLEEVTSGQVGIDRNNLAHVFQRPLLLPWRTVLGNVTFSMECRGVPSRRSRDEAVRILEMMGLGDYLRFKPHELSLGMRQRVDLARALLVKPRTLLMDEPFASLDVDTHGAMQQELLLRWKEQGFTVVFVSHDLDEVVLLSDRVVFLSEKPARINKVVEIDLPRPRAVDTEGKVALVRQAGEFAQYLQSR